jgi:hypothetical protein
MLTASLSAFGAGRRGLRPGRAGAEPPPEAPAVVHVAFSLMHGFRALGRTDPAAGRAEAFRCAFTLTDAHPLEGDHVLQPNLAIAAWVIDDDERSLRLHEDQLSAARRAGALNMVEHALTRGFFSQSRPGRGRTRRPPPPRPCR